MTLKDFKLRDNNHFVAMEYYWLMLNRTFLVVLLNDCLVAIKANGMVSIESGADAFSKHISKSFAISGDLQNPYSYIKNSYIENVENDDLLREDILLKRDSFKIYYKDIKSVYYDKRKKWGMGYYPHDGKVYVLTNDNRKREFIILGSQSGEAIAYWISKRIELLTIEAL